MRLIDADALIERLKYSFRPDERVSIETVTGCFLDETGCAPTIDTEPVKHGHWKCVGSDFGWHYECSECGCTDRYPFDGRHNYCPNCGAKMGLLKNKRGCAII